MKKVLALVLAVIMVCTMAFAVKVEGVTPDSSSTSNYAYSKTLNPGKAILFDTTDLVTGTGVTLSDDDIKDGKIKVAVTFERGADLIASRGWVKMGNQYYYALTAKEGVVATDGTVDIIISAITVTKTGVNASINDMKFVDTKDGKTVYAATNADIPAMTKTTNATMEEVSTAANGIKLCLGFDYGYAPADLVIAADGKSITPADPAADILYTVKREAVANAKSSVTVGKTADETGTPFGYSFTLKAGETVLFTDIGAVPAITTSAAYKALNKNLLDNDATIVKELDRVKMPNKAVTVTFDNAKEGYKMYMVKADGSVVDLGAKFNDNKVLTATAAITGPVIVTDKALTAAGTTTGTTTNPGTGANDVVGVAAALAVVALVSGAAISLKK